MSDRVETQLAVISSLIYSMFAKEPLGYEAFMISKIDNKREKTDKKAEFETRLKGVFKI